MIFKGYGEADVSCVLAYLTRWLFCTKSRAKYNRTRLSDAHDRGKDVAQANDYDDRSLTETTSAWYGRSTSKSRLAMIPRSFRSLMCSIGSSSTVSLDGDARDAPTA